MRRPGWGVRWENLGDESDKFEIFTAPDGREYIRAERDDVADLEIPLPRGLALLRLKNIDHWHAPVGVS